MFEKLKKIKDTTVNAVAGVATRVGDLNGDGVVDAEDARIATQWAKEKASAIGDEASKLGKAAVRSDLAKDAASGAAVGAVVAVPIPVIGPAFGAVVGAGLGIYKNVTKGGSASASAQALPADIHSELLKLDDLRQKGVLSEEEFEIQKKKILRA